MRPIRDTAHPIHDFRFKRAVLVPTQFRRCMTPNPLCSCGDFPVPRGAGDARITTVVSRRRGSQVSSTISSLIKAAEGGDSAATDELFTALYAELHRMAKRELARQGAPPA